MSIKLFYVFLVEWEIAYKDVWCGDQQAIISDTEGTEPDITFQECKERCSNEVECNFILFGIEVYGSSNRCIVLKSCDDRSVYNDNDPNVYRRPVSGNIN